MNLCRWKESKVIIFDKSILEDESIQAPYHYINKDLSMFKKSLIKYGISKKLINRIITSNENIIDYFKEIISNKYRNLCMDDNYIIYNCFAYQRIIYLQYIINNSEIEILKNKNWKHIIKILCNINNYNILKIIKNKFDECDQTLYFIKLIKSYSGEFRNI